MQPQRRIYERMNANYQHSRCGVAFIDEAEGTSSALRGPAIATIYLEF